MQRMLARLCWAAVAVATACGPTSPGLPRESTPNKAGIAAIPAFENPWTLTQQQNTVSDQQPYYWHNFSATPSVASPTTTSGGVYVPFLVDTTDLTNHTTVTTAVTNAAASRYILTLGEFDGHGWTDLQACNAWHTLVTDSSILAHREIRLIGAYTVQDSGAVAGTCDASTESGIDPSCNHLRTLYNCILGVNGPHAGTADRMWDVMALDRYSSDPNIINQRLINYKAAYPQFTFVIPEFGITSNTPPATDSAVMAGMDALSLLWDPDPKVVFYAWWYMGPDSFGTPNPPGNSITSYANWNTQLYDDSATITVVGAHWKTVGRHYP